MVAGNAHFGSNPSAGTKLISSKISLPLLYAAAAVAADECCHKSDGYLVPSCSPGMGEVGGGSLLKFNKTVFSRGKNDKVICYV